MDAITYTLINFVVNAHTDYALWNCVHLWLKYYNTEGSCAHT